MRAVILTPMHHTPRLADANARRGTAKLLRLFIFLDAIAVARATRIFRRGIGYLTMAFAFSPARARGGCWRGKSRRRVGGRLICRQRLKMRIRRAQYAMPPPA